MIGPRANLTCRLHWNTASTGLPLHVAFSEIDTLTVCQSFKLPFRFRSVISRINTPRCCAITSTLEASGTLLVRYIGCYLGKGVELVFERVVKIDTVGFNIGRANNL